MRQTALRHKGGTQGHRAACSLHGDPVHVCCVSGLSHQQANRHMRALLDVILVVLQIYVWLLIAAAILSWLIAFNVVNTRNQVVAVVGDFLYRITEPVLRPIRNIMPNLGGLDISPVIVILIIFFLQSVIVRYVYPNVF
jgi:YggT family protein